MSDDPGPFLVLAGQPPDPESMSTTTLALALLILCAVVLVAVFRLTGFGGKATAVLGVITTLGIWGLMHSVYLSDFWYTPPVSTFLPQPDVDASFASVEGIMSDGGWDSYWLLAYLTAFRWWFGLAYFLVVWSVARLFWRLVAPAWKQR
jgi:hypothetical protein